MDLGINFTQSLCSGIEVGFVRPGELLALIDYWEQEIVLAKARGKSLRTYEKLAKLIEEVRS